MISPEWPALPYLDWESTCDTLHMWTQIVGKTRLALSPLQNHWWNVALYVTPRGLSTSPIPYQGKTFDAEFDFISHQLVLRTSQGEENRIRLYPRSVADFYGEYISCLRSLDIEVRINRTPVEFDDTTPFDQDRHHNSYDSEKVETFRRVLVQADKLLKKFQCGYLGKHSPVHFFWGSFDLAASRFSGRRAPDKPEADAVTREAYSHEVSSCGFWPGDRRFKNPAFYAYTAPGPPNLNKERILPSSAFWDDGLGEFILLYDDIRTASDPERAVLEFCQSTYDAGARLAGWDRTLERSLLSA